ncbi:MAG: DUF4384 domain-containing protein [Alphaproteobacteria bacterium]|nr:DUF4384 domain-containing protein [Alphaproteobacteria bacterium]
MRRAALRSPSRRLGVAAAILIVSAAPLAAQPPPVAASDLLAPTEARAAKAFAVLDRHCARCHDARRLQRRLPAAGISNILDLDALARRRDLVRPGHPDGSPLSVSMVTRHMPYDVLRDLKPGAEPTVQEIADVRAWIEALPAASACAPGSRAHRDQRGLIEADLQQLDSTTAERRRYLSLAQVALPCDGPDALETYRQAAAKLLNLMSRAKAPVRLEPLADEPLLLGFDLADVGWSKADWHWLESLAAGSLTLSGVPGEASGRVIGAGWLADRAMDQGVYARLTGLPASLRDLDTAFGIAPDARSARHDYRVDESEVTGAARTISRTLTPDRLPVWTARDHAGGPLLETRVIFALPNGLPGFALYNRDGTPRTSVHASAVSPEVAQAGATTAGLGCLSCHGGGLAGFETPAGPGSVAPAGWQVQRDNTAFQFAMRETGIPPQLAIDGLEPVVALAERYRRDLGLEQAAAELRLSAASLTGALLAIDGNLQPAARRLLQDLVTRDEFNALRARIAAAGVEPAAATPPPPTPPRETTELRLSLWTQKPGYAQGDAVTLHASASAPCRLTLISVDASGDAVVIFPSDFQDDNRIEPANTLAVPAAGDGFRLRIEEPGRESVIGICMAGDRVAPPGIVHDFELQPFTLLGDWREHIARALAADAAERQKAGKPVRRTRLRRTRGRRIKPLPARSTKLPLPQDWAMITIAAWPEPGAASASSADEATAAPVSRESAPATKP